MTDANIPPLIPRLLPQLTTILKSYPDDPSILASLTSKLLDPVPFTHILSLTDEASLILALQSPAPSANILAMTVLEKAAKAPADAAILAGMKNLLAAFLHAWLISPDVSVGAKGSKVLGALLEVDSDLPLPASREEITVPARTRTPGEGRLWRRMFSDKAISSIILRVCSGQDAATRDDERQLTLAQGRLLRILPHLASLNFRAVSDISLRLDGDNVGAAAEERRSLLHFAALDMVNKRDRLMHLSLVDFFEAFVAAMSPHFSEPSPYKTETVRGLIRSATERDAILKEALLSLPDRIAPEEQNALRSWIRELMPGESIRVGH